MNHERRPVMPAAADDAEPVDRSCGAAEFIVRQASPEWNVRYDPLAARVVARCGVAWTAIGADVQGDNRLTAVGDNRGLR